MAKHRHSHRRSRRILRILLPTLIGLTVLGGSGAYAAYRYEESNAGRVLPGVSVAGVDVGDMTRSQALAAVWEQIDEDLDREIEVTAGDESWHVTPKEMGISARVEAAVDRALGIAEELPWYERAYRRLADKPVNRTLKVAHDFDRGKVRDFVDIVARNVYVSPKNARVDLVDGELVLKRPKRGVELKAKEARRALARAVRREGESVEFSIRTTPPEVAPEDLGNTIVVRLSENQLYLYDGLKVEKTYDVATGQSQYPTPTGTWTIWDKRENPTWVNPAPDGWGADLPRVIGPGPGNPLGTHALYLDAPGIRIHGTYAEGSIGSYASHGCIRMRIADSIDLFDRVDVGTQVLVLW